MRANRTKVHFFYPFKLLGMDRSHPAGVYFVDIERDIVGGASSRSYVNAAAFIYLPLQDHGANSVEAVRINAHALASALNRDRSQKSDVARSRAFAE